MQNCNDNLICRMPLLVQKSAKFLNELRFALQVPAVVENPYLPQNVANSIPDFSVALQDFSLSSTGGSC